jgi:hypothetical protein
MSAIKTHQTFNIVHGDNIEFKNEDGEHVLQIKSIAISRQQPSICQLFTERENTGSLSRGTQVYHGKIESITPGSITSDFLVKARVGDEFHNVTLKCQRSENSECCIS